MNFRGNQFMDRFPSIMLFAAMFLACLPISGCRSAEQILFAEGEEQLRRSAFAEAYATFSNYTRQFPKYSDGYYNLGLAAAGLGRSSEAMADFDSVLAREPSNIDARWMRFKLRGLRIESLKDSSGGALHPGPVQETMISALTALQLEELTAIMQLDRDDISAWYERGMLLRSLGRREEAKKDLDAALLNSPWDMWVRNERGGLYLEMGDFDAALEDYDAALKVCDTCTWLLYNKALSLKASGKAAEATEALAALVVLDSLDGEAWLMLGECNILLERRADACAAFSRSMKLGVREAQERLKELCR
jgi:tetratricopeptide (TPR) repeat protein